MNLPKLTTKQQEILKLLYRYRFLNRIQIQAFLGHKDYKTINLWLKDLRAKQYIEWIYSTHFAERTKPAVYYIGLNGIRFLKTLKQSGDENDDNDDGEESPFYPLEELRKRYRESSRSQTFIDHCILLADCCLTLESSGNTKTHYYYETEADMRAGGYYQFLIDSELIQPDLCFSKDTYATKTKEAKTLKCYLLEIFDATLPRYRLKKSLENYVQFLDNDDWIGETDNDDLPTILLVCPRTSDLIYAKRRTRGLIANSWDYNEDERANIHIQFATLDELKRNRVLGEIWEEA